MTFVPARHLAGSGRAEEIDILSRALSEPRAQVASIKSEIIQKCRPFGNLTSSEIQQVSWIAANPQIVK